MELEPLSEPKVGKLIFSPSWNILCTIKKVYPSGFRFYVHNGDWYGKNYEDHSIVEIRTWSKRIDEIRERVGDFQGVLKISLEEAGNYYYSRS